MNPAMMGLAILAGVMLAGVAASLWSLMWVRASLRAAAKKATLAEESSASAMAGLRRTIETLQARIEEVPLQAAPASQLAPRAGWNLGRRSQALRMHRRGDPPEQIAAALEIPRQEVDLLLKVHRIVIGTII